MSKTHCRFCKETFEGIYRDCPKCGRDLMPKEYRGNDRGARAIERADAAIAEADRLLGDEK